MTKTQWDTILFEGQTRLAFLAEGAAAAGGPAYLPILAVLGS